MDENKTTDFFRDTPVRYLGYANEVGEAFRSIIGGKWVNFTYGIATIYVLADTTHKSIESYEKNANNKSKVAFTTFDTLSWQMLASVAIPGFTINRICAFPTYFIKKCDFLPGNSKKWSVTLIGLATIPFIIKPIDKFVDCVMDETLRKFEPK